MNNCQNNQMYQSRECPVQKMNPTEYDHMIRAMKKYGGSFVKALAQCFVYADGENRKKLFKAFPDYVEKYSTLPKRYVDESD